MLALCGADLRFIPYKVGNSTGISIRFTKRSCTKIKTRQEARRMVAATPICDHYKTNVEMDICLDALSWRGAEIKRKDAELKSLRALKMIVENTCLEEGVKVHKTYLPRPRPRDRNTAAAMQTGDITGDVSAMRATTAHDRLKGEVIPRHRHAARQKQ